MMKIKVEFLGGLEIVFRDLKLIDLEIYKTKVKLRKFVSLGILKS